MTEPGLSWGLAEGRAGGPEEYQTYILLANPGMTAANVHLTFLGDGSGTIPPARDVMVPAQRRLSIGIDGAGLAAGSPAMTFGTSITSDQPIVVERALYWNVNGQVWAAGTNAAATRLP